MSTVAFRQPEPPSIYAYTYGANETREWTGRSGGSGIIKVGYTTRDVRTRVYEQLRPAVIDTPRIILDNPAITSDGDAFRDSDVHKELERQGAVRVRVSGLGGTGETIDSEWFEATPDEVRLAYRTVQAGKPVATTRDFPMRPEQRRAVRVAADYFNAHRDDPKARHFLWNAKMRFGKTFTAYQLVRELGWRRLLILTYKPAVEDAWRNDLLMHQDFQQPGNAWQFIGKGDTFESIDEGRPLAWMASFQDIRQGGPTGEVKERLEYLHAEDWDCVILDEYHFGAWRDAAKAIYAAEPDSDARADAEAVDMYNSEHLPEISAGHWLYLSGTPFRALAEGEFSEDQIFSWSYSDEQAAKAAKRDEGLDDNTNPYGDLPQLVMLTYRLGDIAGKRAETTFEEEFSLNEFFRATSVDSSATFVHEADVQRWLYWLHNSGIREGQPEPTAPYVQPNLLEALRHSVWHLPNVASCHAMADLLSQPTNAFSKGYHVICAAGQSAGVGASALKPVRQAIGDGTRTRSITLTCGKLLTGVTVPQWGAIFMLRDTQSAETYFQAAFRVQSSWSLPDHRFPGRKVVIKHEAYVIDFSPNRSLEMLHGYCAKLASSAPEGLKSIVSSDAVSSEIDRMLSFLPVLAYDDGRLQRLDATDLMDIVASGIGSTMLAKRWQSHRLVNLNRRALKAILADEELLAHLEDIEAFRNLRKHARVVISHDDRVKEAKTNPERNTKPTAAEEKEAKTRRDEIRDALLHLLSRVPIFMYLTDYREESLYDIIHRVEPALFVKVTGLRIDHFDSLCNAGVFNIQILNPAIYAFKRQEALSLPKFAKAEVVSS